MKMAPRKKTNTDRRPDGWTPAMDEYKNNYVAHGSAEHEAALGVATPGMAEEPSVVAAREAQLETPPPVSAKRKPVNRTTYARDEEIMDGWSHKER